MLSALSVASQGLLPFPLSPISVAVQGFISELRSQKHLHQDTDQGKAGKKDYAADNLRRMYEQSRKHVTQAPSQYNPEQLRAEDAMVTDLLVALISKGFLNGSM